MWPPKGTQSLTCPLVLSPFLPFFAQNVLKTGEMLKMWSPKGTQSLTFPLFEAHFGPTLLKTGDMLKMLKFFGGTSRYQL